MAAAEKESKKRKRQSNGSNTANKRVASEGSSAGKIKVTFGNDNVLNPVLVSTPGIAASNVPFKPYAKPLLAKHKDAAVPRPATHDLLLHSSQHPRLDYTASPIALDQLTSHYVALYDPATHQLQITPAHHLSLRSTLRSEAEEDEPDKRRRTIGQQREDLGREFGTKKSKKAIADKTINAIVKDPKGKGKTDVVQDVVLESMAEHTATTTQDAGSELEAQLAAKPIPKPNLQAENVEDVYSFNTLIPPSDARLLQVKEWQDKALADEKVDFAHRFLANRFVSIGKRDDVLRLKALRYLACLLDFHAALTAAGRSGGKKVPKKDVLARKLAHYPEPLVTSIRIRFTNSSGPGAGTELSKWHMDNLYTHICALALYVNGWTTIMSDLKQDLRMENKELGQYFRELGCRVTTPTEKEGREMKNKKEIAATRVARLRVPLEFPRVRVGRRR